MSLFGKSAKELVYDLIVAKNPGFTTKGVTSDKLAFGTPANIAGPGEEDPTYYTRLNTTLDVNGILEKGTFGKFSVTYRRLFMDHLFADVVISVDATGVTTAAGLLPLIRDKYNLIISEDEVYATEAVSGDKHSLRFNGKSFAWIGRLEVYLTEVPSDGVDISKLISVTELDGLVYDTSAS
ncbi:virion structural protein [Erwinia phage vB_EamM_Asesino]|uniref:Virion structural protein n=1 Tax=Erwinia phage vB_EamM_Asesino TaxID=1883370 RepID=A0A1B2IAJ9_9CAUD|nr:virion structural protein [Erwinia phage vB_EamM_Asesino]ANZ48272.1 putative virion structural protein [Erwinia phage vB_EamM_Asesino]